MHVLSNLIAVAQPDQRLMEDKLLRNGELCNTRACYFSITPFEMILSNEILTHKSIVSFLVQLAEPRCDVEERGVPSVAIMLRRGIESLMPVKTYM